MKIDRQYRILLMAIPNALEQERGRLVGAMADSSAHVHGKKFAKIEFERLLINSGVTSEEKDDIFMSSA
ncbi:MULTISPECIES: hypothetical protein [Bradyrhizobium]|uniref:hypothetical protein n=1 Tax=Bradyrhizobium TaxID=374 RepID=UPI00165320BA|nr:MULTISPECIES: hypothetical protein [Bradyrhizobium]